MFNRASFESWLPDELQHWQYRGAYRGLSYCVHPQYAFSSPSSEQGIRITRSPKEPGDSGLKFWINAESLGNWRDGETYFQRYLAASQFRPIDEGEFNKIVATQTHDLVVPITLPLHSSAGYVGGLAMYTLETDLIVSLVAEYEDEFIHFYWDTTA